MRLLLTFHTPFQIILVSDNNQLDQWKQQNSPLVILMRTIQESAKLLFYHHIRISNRINVLTAAGLN